MIARYRPTGLLFHNIREVNKYVNSFRYISDQNNYGVLDYWATPAEFFARGGDCEDFAITKYFIVKENGLGDPILLFVYDSSAKDYHMIVRVGGYILDNQYPDLVSVNDKRLLKYKVLGKVW